MVNKYPREITGAPNPITELWRRRKEQMKEFGDTRKRLKMCSSKKAYETKEIAENATAVKNFNQKTYRCPICKRWHATTKRKK